MHCNLRQPDAALQSLSALISSPVPSLKLITFPLASVVCFGEFYAGFRPTFRTISPRRWGRPPWECRPKVTEQRSGESSSRCVSDFLSCVAKVKYKVHNNGVRRESKFEVKGDSCRRNALCRRIYPQRRSGSVYNSIFCPRKKVGVHSGLQRRPLPWVKNDDAALCQTMRVKLKLCVVPDFTIRWMTLFCALWHTSLAG